MARLTKEEQALLDELTARAAEPDADDFEVEVYDTSAGRGARIPFSKATSWLYDNFGIGEPPAAATSEAGDPPAGKGKAKADPAPPARGGYFGRQAG
jgi:hypothetical protein